MKKKTWTWLAEGSGRINKGDMADQSVEAAGDRGGEG